MSRVFGITNLLILGFLIIVILFVVAGLIVFVFYAVRGKRKREVNYVSAPEPLSPQQEEIRKTLGETLKELRTELSPWISVAGYGIAATTGIFRVIANRHWCSDVLGGAAIGIFSTELAYELTDLLSGDKGIKRAIIVPDLEDMPRWKFGLYSDYSMQSDVFTSDGYGNPDAKPAC